MTRNKLILLAAAGSAALLLGAFAFQYIGGMAPCKMCIYQRWPHAAAIVVGALVLALGNRNLAWLGAVSVLVGSGFALFHVGIEKGWWEGPSTCTSASIEGLTPEQLMEQILTAPIVRCDEIAWEMLGISMAGWNGLASLGLAALWIMAARKA